MRMHAGVIAGARLTETTAYGDQFTAYGETLSAAGFDAVDHLFRTNDLEGVTLSRGWLMGNKVNLTASAGRVLELTGNADFVHNDTADSTLHVGGGSLTLEGDTSLKGYLTCGEPLFTNDDWSMLLYLNKPTRNSASATSTESSLFLNQYDTFANGRFWIEGSFNSGFSLVWLGATSSTINLRTSGLAPIRPLVCWLTYTHSTRQLAAYDAFTGTQLGSTITGPDLGSGNGWSTVNCRIGQPQRAVSNPPRLIQFAGLFKFAEVLDASKRSAVFAEYHDVLTRFNNQILIYGNSVTSGSDASTDTKISDSWPIKFGVWASRNNGFVWMPALMGGKDLYYYRPADYEHPPARAAILGAMVNRDTAAAVDNYTNKRISLLVVDENQNTAASVSVAANSSAMLYSDYTDVLDAIVADLRETIPDMQIVAGTQMALAAQDTSTFVPLTYSQVAAMSFRNNLRDWSASIRADPRYAAVYDLYADFNLGWPVEDDGNAADPINDLPNGDESLFYDDPQHPSSAGHAVMASGYQTAVDAVRRQ